MNTTFWMDIPYLSFLLAAGYLGVLTIAWSSMLIGIRKWGDPWFVSPPEEIPPSSSDDLASFPFVSVCVPARNEEENIGHCVRSILESQWPNLELIVVDDRSEDNTRQVAEQAGQGHEGFRVIDGVEPRKNWAGKPWACYRAAKEAKGTFLLFVDADVQIHPLCIASMIAVAQKRNLTLLSYFGTWTVNSFWEKLLIPPIGWLIRGSIDLDKSNNPSYIEAFANGQLILFRRSDYIALDGHSMVQSEVLEDVKLAQRVKQSGKSAEVRPAPWSFQVRLYRNLSEIINGYTKNMYEGLGRNALMGFGAALFLFFGSLFPYLLLFGMIYGRMVLGWTVPSVYWIVWCFCVVLLQIQFRIEIEKKDNRPIGISWLQPIANAIMIWILLRSTLKVKVQWKGRNFVDGKAQ